MSQNDANFASLLAQATEAYQNADVFDNWMPKDGDYTVIGEAVRKGIKTGDDGKSFAWWSVSVRIIDEGEYADKVFTMQFFSTASESSYRNGMVIVKALTGELVRDAAAIDAFFAEKFPGMAFTVAVRTTKSKKNGKDYTNTRITGVVEQS